MKKEFYVIQQQGVCPKCGSDDLDYLNEKVEVNYVGYDYDCMNCGFSGTEIYALDFLQHIKR